MQAQNNRGRPNNLNHDVREIHSELEREALEMREALYAIEFGYNLTTVLAMSPLSQETYWLLKGEESE